MPFLCHRKSLEMKRAGGASCKGERSATEAPGMKMDLKSCSFDTKIRKIDRKEEGKL